MSTKIKAESKSLTGSTFRKSTLNLAAFIQQAEFQELHIEFERILDEYLEKSKLAKEDEIPGLIKEATMKISNVLSKAAIYTNLQNWYDDESYKLNLDSVN